MPTIKDVGGKVRYSIERFDGGLNTKDSPSKIGPYETPECLNVVFDDAGSVATRDGSAKFNTTAIGAFTIDHAVSYNQTMFVFANGSMYKNSALTGTTFTIVTSTSGKFTAGAKVATAIYQNILFASDGTNGPWKYTGAENFYNMGIDIASACTASGTSAGSVATGTYYYGVSFVNSQAVEGQMGSISAGVTLGTTATIGVLSIPVGSTLAGIDQRFIYRSETTSGPFRKVGTIAGNTTTTFADTTANGAEGKLPVVDGSKPGPFKTIALQKERLFYDNNEDRSVLSYTNFETPFIEEAENQEPINKGDGEDIVAVAAQDDFVTIFKSNKTFTIETTDPADDLTWKKVEVPANIGIVGPKAFARSQNGLIFVGKQNNRLTGFHYLSGNQILETSNGRLRTLSISERIEYDLLNNLLTSAWANITVDIFDNRLYMAYTAMAGSNNNRIFWLDLTRVGDKGQPGSWAPWSGINAKCFVVHNGLFYAGDATATGFMRQLEAGAYGDSGSAINSYFWTKEVGGEDDGQLDSYIKDFREVYIWHARLGSYNMTVRVRSDGDTGDGNGFPIDLTDTGSQWGTMIYGVGSWGGTRTDFEKRISIGKFLGKRFQLRFDNQNTVNQAFKVHRAEFGFNLRRRR